MIKRKLNQLLFGLSLLACLVGASFVNPVSAHASAKKAIETTIETSPANPKGSNDWYTSVTMVKLESNISSTTYFQWNTTEEDWIGYKTPIRAFRGENILYYYSVTKSGVSESVKSKTIKVDYEKPVIEKVKSESVDASTKITVDSIGSDLSYQIYKRINGHYEFLETSSSNIYFDKDVKIGQTYVYKIVAIDPAGLLSKRFQAVVKIVEPPKVEIVVAPTLIASVMTVKSVQPQIAQGASTVSSVSTSNNSDAVKPKAEEGKNTEVTEPVAENKPIIPAKNWNRLFVAISILILAIVASIGSYYAYEWWSKRTTPKAEVKPKEKKSNSRW